MSKGRFLNQKLGKRMSRKYGLLKSQLSSRHTLSRVEPPNARLPKKGASREQKPLP